MSPSELSGIYSRLRELEVIVQQQDAEISRLRYEVADLQEEANVNSTKLSCW
jgi:uncharacterized coiled-coil protein SlyX